MDEKPTFKYELTQSDIDKYNDAVSNNKIDQIWWEVLSNLPSELFKEAITKRLNMRKLTNQDNPNATKLEFYIEACSAELDKAVADLGIEILLVKDAAT